MEAKTIQQAPDPNLAPEKQQATQGLLSGLQNQAELDTASLMARFGTKLALSGMGTSATSMVR